MQFDYGFAYKRYPINEGETAVFDDGSMLAVHDIMNPLPGWMKTTDILFTDSPWNTGNLRSFYTKAELPPSVEFAPFMVRLFDCLKEIQPSQCWLEIGKQHLADYIMRMRDIYKHVTFFNSTYYHDVKKLCYVVVGSSKRIPALKLDGMDEEDIIAWMAEHAPENAVLGDLCMGRGLVALAAYKTGHRFVGTELNGKRLSVALERLDKLGAPHKIQKEEKEGNNNGSTEA